jgi:hypothetical protein
LVGNSKANRPEISLISMKTFSHTTSPAQTHNHKKENANKTDTIKKNKNEKKKESRQTSNQQLLLPFLSPRFRFLFLSLSPQNGAKTN